MKEDSPHGAARLAEALAILSAGTNEKLKPYIALGIARRDYFEAAIDCAIEYGVSVDAANKAHALLTEYHRIPPPPLSGMVDMSIDPKRVQRQLIVFGEKQLELIVLGEQRLGDVL